MKSPAPSPLAQRHQGFTLVELIITIAIISVLVAIALPSYREYVARTNRTVAKVALQELLTKQESYASDHKGYTSNFSRLGYPGTGTTTAYVTSDGVISLNSANALYQFALHASVSTSAMSATCAGLSATGPAATAPGLAISATPVSAGSDARCATLCVSSRGERGASGTGGVADCWRR
ncbi:MAG: type IV pilin protein [Pseudomonadota bacterium]